MLGQSPIVTVLATTNLDKARHFYTDTLGLKVKETRDDGITFGAGNNTTCLVYLRDNPPKSDFTQLTFKVENVEKAVQDLVKKGVNIERYPGFDHDANGIVEMTGKKSAWFLDPDKNILCVSDK